MNKINLPDVTLKDYNLTPRVAKLRSIYFQAMPEVCIERPRLITKFYRNNNLFGKEHISILDKAKMYRYVLENRTPIISHSGSYESQGAGKPMKHFDFEETSLFAGATTSKFKGVLLYPEFLALSIWPELKTISTRQRNPYHLSETEAEELNSEIFPYWMDYNILELTRDRYMKEKGADSEIQLMQRLVFFLGSKNNCISHTLPDFSKAIKLGLRAVIDEAKAKRDQASDIAQREFYCAIVEVLKGIIAYANNLATKAEELAKAETRTTRRQELMDIATIYRRVPELPARTFREGLTAVWICWTAIHLENPNIGLSLGRLDQLLYDLYKSSIESGLMTVGDAVELVSCLWLKIGDHVPMIPDAGEQLFGGTGSNQAITIGGIKATNDQPEDAVNDLTYIMLRATELMMLRDPNLNARYYPGVNSKEYLHRLCDANLKTKATPALHNDKAVIKALMAQGETFAEASDYGIVGCVEPASNGRAYTASASIMINLPSLLELTLYNGCHRHTGLDVLISKKTGAPENFSSYEEFQDAFKQQIEWIVEQTTGLNDQLGKTHQQVYPTPILSALFEGPMENGKDLIQGGAKINASGVTIIGLADTADSLSAIEHVIYQTKKATFAELLEALDKNFAGHEKLQAALVDAPKYGNENSAAEGNVKWLMTTIHNAFQAKTNYRGGKYRVGYWSMTNHAGFGRLIQAHPNGRRARANFSSGITPASGMTPILTPVLNSLACLPATCVTSGMALNLKYTPEANQETMCNNLTASVAAYFDDLQGERDGGMEIQFNISDHDTFVNAIQHPDPELLVRVSGYTAYFKDLNPRMQEEIINRTEYSLSDRQAQTYTPFTAKEEGKALNLEWIRQIPGAGYAGDQLLEMLLHGMSMSFWFSKEHRRNIANFTGNYVFTTKDGKVAASVTFARGSMKVHASDIPNWNVRVTFADEVALMEFLFAENQDILNSLLENKVAVEGNLNYIYRFGYLAKNLRDSVLTTLQIPH